MYTQQTLESEKLSVQWLDYTLDDPWIGVRFSGGPRYFSPLHNLQTDSRPTQRMRGAIPTHHDMPSRKWNITLHFDTQVLLSKRQNTQNTLHIL
jgi:hypothetical protein